MARLTWVKTMSRYNNCIVTEAIGMVLVRYVLQSYMCIVIGKGAKMQALYRDTARRPGHDTARARAALGHDTAA